MRPGFQTVIKFTVVEYRMIYKKGSIDRGLGRSLNEKQIKGSTIKNVSKKKVT